MSSPFRIALVTTQYSEISHSDVIVSRWLEPRPTDPSVGWSDPQTTIASMYVDQILANDISEHIGQTYGVPRFESVRSALTLGGSSLAVDAVLLIGEHGDYPRNALGQKLYPRKQLFDQVVQVFRESGRVVPIFFDKHFSWDVRAIHEMYQTVRALKIPFFGGSSVPHSPLSAPLDLPPSRPDEAVIFYWNEVEDYLFHSLEFSRSILERCENPPSRLERIVAWKDQSVWEALDAGQFSSSLFEAAAAAVSPPVLDSIRQFRQKRATPIYAFQLTYEDGFRETHIMQEFVRKWSFACAWNGSEKNTAAYALTGVKGDFYSHFARLNRLIEDFFLTGQAPISIDRLYLTSMATAGCMQALAHPGVPQHPSWIRLPVPASMD